MDLPPAPPLPDGLLGQRLVFQGGVWEVLRAPPLRMEVEEAQEQPSTPPAVVPPRGRPPAHLWQQPPYIILNEDEEDNKKNEYKPAKGKNISLFYLFLFKKILCKLAICGPPPLSINEKGPYKT